jgi:hypothetical protein
MAVAEAVQVAKAVQILVPVHQAVQEVAVEVDLIHRQELPEEMQL